MAAPFRKIGLMGNLDPGLRINLKPRKVAIRILKGTAMSWAVRKENAPSELT